MGVYIWGLPRIASHQYIEFRERSASSNCLEGRLGTPRQARKEGRGHCNEIPAVILHRRKKADEENIASLLAKHLECKGHEHAPRDDLAEARSPGIHQGEAQ